jgi:hypothetical protein
VSAASTPASIYAIARATSASPRLVGDAVLDTFSNLTQDDQYLYWIEADHIYWVPKSGGTLGGTTFSSELAGALTVDATRMYWTTFYDRAIHAMIKRSTADTIIGHYDPGVSGLIIVPPGIYFGSPDLFWDPLDGTSAVRIGSAKSPGHLKPIGDVLYWTDDGVSLRRGRIDGSGEDVVDSRDVTDYAVATDVIYLDRFDHICSIPSPPGP